MVCGLIVIVATAGKFGGTVVSARLTSLGWRDSTALGVLMNTRGLMELIVLNIGLDLKVITPTLFAMMVLMALVTTLAATPILQLLTPGRLSPMVPSRRSTEHGPMELWFTGASAIALGLIWTRSSCD